MSKKQDYSIKSVEKYLTNRSMELSRLRNTTSPSVQEYVNTIIKSYKESSVVKRIALRKEEEIISSIGYRRIGLYPSIEKDKLFAKDYYWNPFFSDVGRAISRAERKYIHNRLGKYIRGVDDKISFHDPDPKILRKYVIKLLEKNVKPNVILAPIQIYSKIVKRLWDEFGSNDWRTDQIRIESCDIEIAWSHRYAPLNSFIILDSSAGIWHVLQDTDSSEGITVAMGESKESNKHMVCIAETMAYYEIVDKEAFTRINLSY